ncbi:hypothetical protein HDU97_002253 [Phlyctochytrium planicorne]|nr:hypothetical protein HDU97_002253 [Phlyctochytrium planicorne]
MSGKTQALLWRYEKQPNSGIATSSTGWKVAGQCAWTLSWNPMEFAAGNGDLELVKWMFGRAPYLLSHSAITNAARGGHIPVLEWIASNALVKIYDEQQHQTSKSDIRKQNPMYAAAESGQLGTVKWLNSNWSNDFLKLGSSIDAAAGNGHLDVVKWLHENRAGCTAELLAVKVQSRRGKKWSEACTVEAFDEAAGNGHLEVVKWLHENRTEGCTTEAMDRAATNGHLEVVKWLHFNRTEGCATEALDGAATSDHLEIRRGGFLSPEKF